MVRADSSSSVGSTDSSMPTAGGGSGSGSSSEGGDAGTRGLEGQAFMELLVDESVDKDEREELMAKVGQTSL